MKFSLTTIVFLLAGVLCFAQQPQDEKAREKQFRENIDREVERYTDVLKLDDWQVFYVDSVLTCNYTAMRDELKAMSESRVSNQDLYFQVQDKWMEKTYIAFKKFLNEEQWTKYLKIGAARDKKARDKRSEKRNK